MPLMPDYQINQVQSDVVPRFFVKKNKYSTPAGKVARKVTCLGAARELRKDILDSDDLDDLWTQLCSYTPEGQEKRINFLQFQESRSLLGEKFYPYLKASLFLHFKRDDDAKISVDQYFNYVLRRVSLLQARIDVSAYDNDGDGSLQEDELKRYIEDLMPSLQLKGLTKNLHRFYLEMAVRKFLFFLDPKRRGKIHIQTMLLSPILTEFFEMKDPEIPQEYEDTNWFSAVSTLRIYGQFRHLDSDQNGLLSRQEMSRFRSGTYSNLFLNRVFQECRTHKGQLDFTGFVEFLLVLDNASSPEALAIWFKWLDLEGKGYLDEFTLNQHLKEVNTKMTVSGHDQLPIPDLLNEIFDMANPENEDRVTLKDIETCGVGGTIVSILVDSRALFAYEMRDQDK